MKRTASFFFFGLAWALVFPAFAQNKNFIDSLHRQLSSNVALQRYQLYNELGFAYRYSHPDSTIYYCQQAYELGVRLDLSRDLSRPLSFIGLAYTNKGDFRQSLHFHERAVETAKIQNDSVQLGHGFNNLGRLFFAQGDLIRSYSNFVEGERIFSALGDKEGLAYIYRSLANVFKSQKDYDRALEMSRQALQLRKSLGNVRSVVSSLMELALVYREKGDFGEALRNLEQADREADRLSDVVTEAEVSLALAEVLAQMGKWNEAEARAQEVLQTVTAGQNLPLYLRASLVSGDFLTANKQYRQAIQRFKAVLALAEAGEEIHLQRETCDRLAAAYRAMGEREEADGYSARARDIAGRLESRGLLREIESLRFQLQLQEKEKENELLKTRQQRNETIIQNQRWQNLTFLAVALFAGALVALQWRNGRRQKTLVRKLKEQNEQIRRQQEEIGKQNDHLSRRNDELYRLNREKDTLMNIVAHDFRSPLNQIAGLTNLLEMKGGLDTEQQEYIRLIRNATRSGSDFVADLLDVNAIEANVHPLDWQEIDLVAFLGSRIDFFRLAADRKDIRLNFAHAVPNRVRTDPYYLNRILDNLISNAIKFSPPHKEVLVNTHVHEHKLVIEVHDHGPGFSAEDQQKMFGKFTKLSARPTAGESSSGLGLAIVKTLVERMEGNVELTTSREGSTFRIELPLLAEPLAGTR